MWIEENLKIMERMTNILSKLERVLDRNLEYVKKHELELLRKSRVKKIHKLYETYVKLNLKMSDFVEEKTNILSQYKIFWKHYLEQDMETFFQKYKIEDRYQFIVDFRKVVIAEKEATDIYHTLDETEKVYKKLKSFLSNDITC